MTCHAAFQLPPASVQFDRVVTDEDVLMAAVLSMLCALLLKTCLVDCKCIMVNVIHSYDTLHECITLLQVLVQDSLLEKSMK